MKKILDVIGGLFLISTGLVLVFIYMCLRSKADNWFVSFMILVFLLGLGAGATVLGCLRIYRTVKENT